MARLFEVIADTTRLKILLTIYEEEKCVCQIQDAIGASQSLVSHQLAVLKKARLVRNRKVGRHSFYLLDDEHVKQLLLVVREHVQEGEEDYEESHIPVR